ncbi:MAG TPA: tetratricopeptide repeat protein [Candidatus Paceibacterota bacterium]|nr:tetratricopeptide repeat protein [Verrucomicrobiota bacterium]HRY46481.1 tetratricopeptide repeat protein [Candidatus Paceibacterota bacterium]
MNDRQDPGAFRLAEQAVAYADWHHQQNNLQAARDFLELANKAVPGRCGILRALGSLNYQVGDWPRSQAVLTELVELSSEDSEVLSLHAAACLKAGDEAAFETSIKRAIDLDPDNVEAGRLLAGFLMQHKAYLPAARLYYGLLRRLPSDIPALLSLGKCLYHGGDPETAAAVYERVQQMDPTNDIAAEALKLIMPRSRPCGDGEADIRPDTSVHIPQGGGDRVSQASSSEPAKPADSINHWLARADSAYSEGDLVRAASSLRQATFLAPEDAQLWASLGSIEYLRENYPDARLAFQEAVRLHPDNPTFHLQLAQTCLKEQRVEDFETALSQVLRLDPNNEPALMLLGDLNFENGRVADAARIFHRILQNNAASINALLRLGKCFYQTEDFESARLCYEQVLHYESANSVALEAMDMIRAQECNAAVG